MSELTEKIAREHNEVGLLGRECVCGWTGADNRLSRHIAEVTEAAVRAEATVTPSREDVATAVHAALAPWWMTIFPAIGGTQEAYEDLTSAIADVILALLPGRSEEARQ